MASAVCDSVLPLSMISSTFAWSCSENLKSQLSTYWWRPGSVAGSHWSFLTSTSSSVGVKLSTLYGPVASGFLP